jgi:hypothetical protein
VEQVGLKATLLYTHPPPLYFQVFSRKLILYFLLSSSTTLFPAHAQLLNRIMILLKQEKIAQHQPELYLALFGASYRRAFYSNPVLSNNTSIDDVVNHYQDF